jgi:hypothetical protein
MMNTQELHQNLRYLNWKIHQILHCTKDEQLTLELKERLVELSVAIFRAIPAPWEQKDE